jgi:hypothetical protein
VVNNDPDDRSAPDVGDETARHDLPRLRVVGNDVYANWDANYIDNVARI